MTNRVDGGIGLGADVADEIGLSKEAGVLRSHHRSVFHNSLQATIHITERQRETMRELLFKTNDIFLSKSEPGTRRDRIAGVLGRNRSLTSSASARCVGNEMRRINYRNHSTKGT